MKLAMPSTGHRAGNLTKLEQAAANVGMTLPKAYRDAAQDHRTMLAAVHGYTSPDRATFAEALLDAIAAGRDPLLDDQVQRHVAVGIIADQRTDIVAAAGKREKAIVRDHRAALVKAATKALEGALDAIRHAAEVAPNLGPTSDPKQVIDAGATASTAWTAANEGQKQVQAFTALLRSLGHKVDAAGEVWLTVEPTTLPAKARVNTWTAALHGATLAPVKSIEEHRDRLAEVEAIETARARKRADEQQAARTKKAADNMPLVRAEADRIRRRNAALESAAKC